MVCHTVVRGEGMNGGFHVYRPQPPLSACVTCFWSRKGPPETTRELAFPTGTVELVISLTSDGLRVFGQAEADDPLAFTGAMLCGPHLRHFVIDSSPNDDVIGVNFLPGGVFPFVDVPVDSLLNQHIAFEDVWKAKAHELRERLIDAPDPYERFRRLERLLLEQAYRSLTFDPRVAHALARLHSPEHVEGVAALAEEVNLSRRRFVELFRVSTGFTPKEYARIRRFQQAITLIGQGTPRPLVDVAHACGYYDQAHFNHEFLSMSGITPGEYLSRRGERVNHVPVE